MNLSDYIKKLQALELQGYGGLPVVYSDAERNDFHKVEHEPTCGHVEDTDGYYLQPTGLEDESPNVIFIN